MALLNNYLTYGDLANLIPAPKPSDYLLAPKPWDTRTPFLDKILNWNSAKTPADFAKPRLEMWNQVIHDRIDTLNGAINDSATSVVVDNDKYYSINCTIQIDDEVMLVSAINYSTHTLTVSRAFAGSAASHADDSTIYIGPQVMPEVYTSLMNTTVTQNALPTPFYNYAEQFFVDISASELQENVAQNGDQNMETLLQRKITLMKRQMELKTILGIPKAPANSTTSGAMGGVKYFTQNNGGLVHASVDSELTFDDLRLAALEMDRRGGVPKWLVMEANNWNTISKGWIDTIMASRRDTTVGTIINQLETPFGVLQILPIHDIPRNWMLLLDTDYITMAPVANQGFTRYEKKPGADTTIHSVIYRGWYSLRIEAIENSCCLINGFTTVSADGK